jgi:hypothetical protein
MRPSFAEVTPCGLFLAAFHWTKTNLVRAEICFCPTAARSSADGLFDASGNCPALTINIMKTIQALHPDIFITILHIMPNCQEKGTVADSCSYETCQRSHWTWS